MKNKIIHTIGAIIIAGSAGAQTFTVDWSSNSFGDGNIFNTSISGLTMTVTNFVGPAGGVEVNGNDDNTRLGWNFVYDSSTAQIGDTVGFDVVFSQDVQFNGVFANDIQHGGRFNYFDHTISLNGGATWAGVDAPNAGVTQTGGVGSSFVTYTDNTDSTYSDILVNNNLMDTSGAFNTLTYRAVVNTDLLGSNISIARDGLALKFGQDLSLASVPEPSSTALLGLGCFGLLIRRKR